MTTVVTTDAVSGTVIDPGLVNNNFSAVKSTVNGNIDNANIAGGAAIAVAKLEAGSNTQVLTTTGGVAVWAAPAAGGGGGDVPAGALIMWGGSAAPSGYLLCDGTAVSRTTYADLFTAYGIAYGAGDGSTTFNLPDLRGRVAVGKGTHTDVDALGDNDGVTLANRSTKHHHTFTSGNQTGFSSYITRMAFDTGLTATKTSGNANNADGPAFLTVNFIVKT